MHTVWSVIISFAAVFTVTVLAQGNDEAPKILSCQPYDNRSAKDSTWWFYQATMSDKTDHDGKIDRKTTVEVNTPHGMQTYDIFAASGVRMGDRLTMLTKEPASGDVGQQFRVDFHRKGDRKFEVMASYWSMPNEWCYTTSEFNAADVGDVKVRARIWPH